MKKHGVVSSRGIPYRAWHDLIDNFLTICGMKRDWTPASFVESTVQELSKSWVMTRFILALSGGVDSSVTAVLLNKLLEKTLPVCL